MDNINKMKIIRKNMQINTYYAYRISIQDSSIWVIANSHFLIDNSQGGND